MNLEPLTLPPKPRYIQLGGSKTSSSSSETESAFTDILYPILITFVAIICLLIILKIWSFCFGFQMCCKKYKPKKKKKKCSRKESSSSDSDSDNEPPKKKKIKKTSHKIVIKEPCKVHKPMKKKNSSVQVHPEEFEAHVKFTASIVFDLLKAHLKRAPSLRGAALVRLASLKMQAEPWPTLYNTTKALSRLNELEITSDNWFENVLRIYEQRRKVYNMLENVTNDSQTWAYPIISKAFYDPLSHKIVVPLSLILVPYFHPDLPPYLHFSSVGISIAKEILRSVTKAFEDKAMRCVPTAVEIFSNSSRMELLISSGGMQIALHSMLTLSGSKAMMRLPGLNLSSTQIFFLVTAQELCSKSQYEGIETESEDFHDILFWLIAQGGTASQHFQCQYGTTFRLIQNCGIW
ncbi:hypothetical protein PVAND_002282 [Polypedilum vanderplanki]|uniref:Uncharacterized protein n=1 Tax=Polypedilum vanderplanki TaxID=319348 RepID=A0A9J6BQR7_POLVA|nr:hypothetical protein PVAND_002282 [Polypedilum vanderplanki]